ncbi:hypothetical protein CRYUN_Cryun16bG0132800 [Craigia yunnanensis]
MANRDRPVNGKQSRLTLHDSGNLVLLDADGSIVWLTNTPSNAAAEVRLLETGNLVLINQAKNVIWESFNFPTDTLLASQRFTRNTTLVSMRSKGTYLSGFYNLKFDDNNVLDLLYNGPLLSSVCWPNPVSTIFYNGRTPYNSSRIAVINEIGSFRSSDTLFFNASDYGVGPKRRLTLDYDGIIRLYSLDESTGSWKLSWRPGGLDACMVQGLCGFNGICSYNPLPTCICPSAELDFVELPKTDYYGYDLETYEAGITLETCRDKCLKDCRCKGFGYALDGQGQCFPKGALRNGYGKPNNRIIMHIKVPKGMVKSFEEPGAVTTNVLNCSTGLLVLENNSAEEGKTNKNGATKNFKEQIGKGGFSTVYKGVLDDKRVVAVKRLEGVLQGETQFWAENGSLDKMLFLDSPRALGWDQRFNIAVGTAKGLSYLHEECLEWVLHCDVKPQNILIDSHFEPKMADFGMSMLFKDGNDRGFSKVRGTRGYLAPEWMMNLKINAKADVYSYGIVLLELLTGKSASGLQSANSLDKECSDLEELVTESIRQEELQKIIDPKLKDKYNKEQLKRMVEVAPLCIKDDRSTRPAMSKVTELLIGND